MPWNFAANLASTQLWKQNKPLYQLLASNLNIQAYAVKILTIEIGCLGHFTSDVPSPTPKLPLTAQVNLDGDAKVAGSYSTISLLFATLQHDNAPCHNYVLFGYSIVLNCDILSLAISVCAN